MAKSKLTLKKPIPWGEVIVIKELIGHPNVIQQMEESIKAAQPEVTQDQLNQQIHQLLLRDNYFNSIMDVIAQCFEFDFNEAEITHKVGELQAIDPKATAEFAREIVKLNIMRELIFAYVAKELAIEVADEQVKVALDRYYQDTGKPIREFLANREKFEDAKKTMSDQFISERIMNAFKADFQLDAFYQKMRAQQENAKAAEKAPKPN